MVTEVLAALDEVRAPPHIERGRPLDVIRHLGAIEPTGYDPGVDAILEEFLRIAPGCRGDRPRAISAFCAPTTSTTTATCS